METNIIKFRENLEDFAKSVLMVSKFVERLNDTYDKEELPYGELYNVTTDEMAEHRVISIYETLEGTCLVSAKFDKESGEMSMTDHDYVYDRFGDYTKVVGMQLLNSVEEVDLTVFMASAYIAAILFAGSEGARKEFQTISRQALD